MKTSESVKEILPALLSVTDSMQAEKDGRIHILGQTI